jgi:ATP-dependent Clp protease ATP-binding subunit ClpC
MFEKFTVKARRVIFVARYEASKRGATSIEPCHLLAGLEREETKETEQFVAQHPEMATLRERVNPKRMPWPKVSTSVDMPLTEASRHALRVAVSGAESHASVGTAELLRGLLSVAKGEGPMTEYRA